MGEQKEVDGVGMLFITLKADSNEKMAPVYSENEQILYIQSRLSQQVGSRL